jgi:hypothetical protein
MNTFKASSSNVSISDLLKKYNSTHTTPLNIHILTPCYGGMCHLNYMTCILNTISLFNLFNISYKLLFTSNDSLITRARNNLVAKSMSDPDMTHIIFIDNDITWDPVDILKLIIHDKPIVGGIYPIKRYYWDKLKNSNFIDKNTQNDENTIQSSLLEYNLNYISNKLTIENNITEVKHIATGFMMIQRNTIEELFKEYPETKYTDDVDFLNDEQNKYAYALFDCKVIDDHYYSEDWLFCHRLTLLNKKIYADISIDLTHSGMEHYKGSIINALTKQI